MCVALALALLGATDASAGLRGTVARANKALEAGDIETAERLYAEAQTDHPDSPLLQYDMGTAKYRKGDYAAAEASFRAAAAAADDDQLAAKAWYNLGNAVVRQAQGQGDTSRLKEALGYYRKAIELSGDHDAKYNYECVLQLLEQMKKQQQQAQGGESQKNQKDQDDKQQSQGREDNKQERAQQQQEKQQQEKGQQQQEGQPQTEQQQQEAGRPEGEQEQQGGQGAQQAQEKQMTPEQARRLLDSLGDEGRALLQPPKQVRRLPPVEKDW